MQRDKVPVEISREEVIVNEGTTYSLPIYPENPGELDRKITICKNSKIKGGLFGKKLKIKDECEIIGDVFGEDRVTIEDDFKITGSILSMGDINIGRNMYLESSGSDHMSIVGSNIRIGKNSIIEGHVFGRGDINIGKNSNVKGFVISVDGKINLGDSVLCHDVLTHDRIELGDRVEINDNVIWAPEGITHGKLLMAGSGPKMIHKERSQGKELNLNTDRSKIKNRMTERFDYDRDMFWEIRRTIPSFDIEDIFPNKKKGIVKKKVSLDSIKSKGRLFEDDENFEDDEETEAEYEIEKTESRGLEDTVEHPIPPVPEKTNEEEQIEKISLKIGISPSTAEALYQKGYHSIDDLKGATRDDLLEVKGVGLALSEIIMESLENL